MYYHVIVETSERIGKKDANRKYYELDRTSLPDIVARVVHPFLRQNDLQIDGYFLNHSDIRRIAVRQSEKSSKELAQFANDNMPRGVITYISPTDAIADDGTSGLGTHQSGACAFQKQGEAGSAQSGHALKALPPPSPSKRRRSPPQGCHGACGSLSYPHRMGARPAGHKWKANQL
jgi:hypothetical protein